MSRFEERYDTINELKDAVRRAFQKIALGMLRRMSYRTWRSIFVIIELQSWKGIANGVDPKNIVRNGNINIRNLSFEEVEKLKYLGATVTNEPFRAEVVYILIYFYNRYNESDFTECTYIICLSVSSYSLCNNECCHAKLYNIFIATLL
ncbi:hypothetical protein ANN_09585 [Periplaneta americana]|uniref:Uncharacterized protein n=1 Tax=Periplaneta americana TaxID=6978 RepID=A0ABQ8TMQ7_PERAM|nr:hypothetical protein ANN_09585 [Periplaneta americana]